MTPLTPSRLARRYGGSGAFEGLAWLIRFYSDGDPPHIGAQPPILVDASALIVPESANASGSSRRRLAASGISVGLDITSDGSSPFDEIVNSDDGLTVDDDYALTNESSSGESIAYVPPVHICGNGIRSTAEACDDNNTLGGDGCDALCRVETGFVCTSSVVEGSGIGGLDTCVPRCGDGVRVLWRTEEECDDNNTLSGDGCSANCTIETGFTCAGGSIATPDACVPRCGDGLRVQGEVCDGARIVAVRVPR